MEFTLIFPRLNKGFYNYLDMITISATSDLVLIRKMHVNKQQNK